MVAPLARRAMIWEPAVQLSTCAVGLTETSMKKPTSAAVAILLFAAACASSTPATSEEVLEFVLRHELLNAPHLGPQSEHLILFISVCSAPQHCEDPPAELLGRLRTAGFEVAAASSSEFAHMSSGRDGVFEKSTGRRGLWFSVQQPVRTGDSTFEVRAQMFAASLFAHTVTYVVRGSAGSLQIVREKDKVVS